MTASDHTIRAARPADAPALTAIVRAGKAHWGYSDDLLRLWDDELRVTEDEIRHEIVLVAEVDGEPAAVGTVEGTGEERDLDDLYVHPRFIGQGLGSSLLDALLDAARRAGVRALSIAADPNAESFYLKKGAVRVGRRPSRPPGRTLPLLRLLL